MIYLNREIFMSGEASLGVKPVAANASQGTNMPFMSCPLWFQRTLARASMATVILTALFALAFFAGEDEAAISGQWKITAALDGAEITSLDEREARQLVGGVFTISKEKVVFGKRDCGPSTFEAQSVEPRLFLREQFHATSEKLGLPNPVTVVDLSCTSVFIKNQNRLVIAWDGWFFDAVRVKP
jgi:hypothetical protein